MANFPSVTGQAAPRVDLLSRRVQDELLLLDVKGGKIHHLNNTAALIWEKLTETQDPEEIASMMAEEFEIDYDMALGDLVAFMRRLQELHLVIKTQCDQV